MNKYDNPTATAWFDINTAAETWRRSHDSAIGMDKTLKNRSRIEVQPLYWPADDPDGNYAEKLGFPGANPMTRGIYPTMHRGRTWSQRQLIGLGRPADFNRRVKRILASGATALSIIPCNSVYRGQDCDEVDAALLGTCGTVINTVDDMDICLQDIPIDELSIGLNDPSPFTMLAQMLVVAENRGIDWTKISGTSNQSDYISHFVANHMFYRLSLTGARRVLLDTIEFLAEHVPNWNPLSVVGQHMQQAGATPAEAMGLTLSSAIQYAEDCRARGMDPEKFLERFTFFFDISISFFEEVAKFRAGRRIWNRLVGERFGVTNPRAKRFKFHAQTSGCDLTRQQPMNNIARVTVQAMAGILGGLQSLHTDGYDEVVSTPSEASAKIAIATQNILKHEAHLCDVIDPLGGSYYVEALTDAMEKEILNVIARIDAEGGMFKAVESGFVQRMIGVSALEFQDQVERGEQIVVGVNAYQEEEEASARPALKRPDRAHMGAQIARLTEIKAGRDRKALATALGALREAARSQTENVFAAEIDAVRAGATLGEIVTVLREELGFGQPLIVA
ncbi:acyl-CoA mutase large subunit family protein [Nisaea sp.]|uniref:acyl-CoA mutase large subunit family protein n=1 Tax=Nisaea sp. TaxID=2024842 RepID=UPI003B524C2A